jgi:hypothetical protein
VYTGQSISNAEDTQKCKTYTNKKKIGKNPLISWATIVDCGDVPMAVLDNNYALAQLTKGHKVGRTYG